MSMFQSEGASLLIKSLPADWREARLLGRLQLPEGATPVLIEKGRVYDVSRAVPTVADAVAKLSKLGSKRARHPGPLEALTLSAPATSGGPTSGGSPAHGASTTSAPVGGGQSNAIEILSPIDLQVIKASGVTFAISALERVIDERSRGNFTLAQQIR